MLNRHARGFFTALFTPLARWLLKIGVSPDAVTVIGTAGVVVGALVFYPLGQLWWGTLFITAFIFSDVLDGIMARLRDTGRPLGKLPGLHPGQDRRRRAVRGRGHLVLHRGRRITRSPSPPCSASFLGMVVSYARSKAESLGFTANVGIAERAERLVSVLVVTGFTGLGLPPVVLLVTLGLLALASLITIIQRVATVHRQALAESAARIKPD